MRIPAAGSNVVAQFLLQHRSPVTSLSSLAYISNSALTNSAPCARTNVDRLSRAQICFVHSQLSFVVGILPHLHAHCKRGSSLFFQQTLQYTHKTHQPITFSTDTHSKSASLYLIFPLSLFLTHRHFSRISKGFRSTWSIW